MTTVFKDQRRFMIACEQTVVGRNEAQAEMYHNLITEEYDEMLEANSRTEELDALIDMMVVIIGYGLSSGYDMEGAWNEVMTTNFWKIDQTTGKVKKREDGKVLKPDGWVPPDLTRFV